MELALEELEVKATEDELAAGAASFSTVSAPLRRFPVRKPFPEHLLRDQFVIAAPTACPYCGSTKLSKLGKDIAETLEVIPRSWKAVQTVRERFSCWVCQTIARPIAPFHATLRGFAGPSLPAMILFEKFGQRQPLNRQSERYAQEGIDLSVSTLADQVGACTAALAPLHTLIARHVMVAERLHGGDITVPILAKGWTVTGRIWTYVRDDRSFRGPNPHAALFYASRDRAGAHSEAHLSGFGGILQADAYSGYNRLYEPARPQGPVTSALCWAHAHRGFFVLADVAAKVRRGKTAAVILPIALEAARRIDALFAIERAINGRSADERLRVRCAESAPLTAWLREQRARLSYSFAVAEPTDYLLRRWPGL